MSFYISFADAPEVFKNGIPLFFHYDKSRPILSEEREEILVKPEKQVVKQKKMPKTVKKPENKIPKEKEVEVLEPENKKTLTKEKQKFYDVTTYPRGYINDTIKVEKYINGKLSASKEEKMVFFHATTSTTLLLLDVNEPKFIPTVQLLKKGIVPLSGELSVGVSSLYGVNVTGLSVAVFDYLKYSVRYALNFNPPKTFDECFKEFQSNWSPIVNSYKYYKESGSLSELVRPFFWTKCAIQILRMKILDNEKYKKDIEPKLLNSETWKNIEPNLVTYRKAIQNIIDLIDGKLSEEEARDVFDYSWMIKTDSDIKDQWESWKTKSLPGILETKLVDGPERMGPYLAYYYQFRDEFPELLTEYKAFARKHCELIQERYEILLNAMNQEEPIIVLNDELKASINNPVPILFGVSENALPLIKGFDPVFEGKSVSEATIESPSIGKELDSIIVRSSDKETLMNYLARFENIDVNIYTNDQVFQLNQE